LSELLNADTLVVPVAEVTTFVNAGKFNI
jgi:hypothetical protein